MLSLNWMFMWILITVLHLIMIVLSFGGMFGAGGRIIITGWLCSCYFAIILETCSGSDDMPTMGFTDGFWDDVTLPFLKFFGSWLIVLAPCIIWTVMMFTGGSQGDEMYLEGEQQAGMSGAGSWLIWLALLAVGLFFWPMMILTVAINGFSSAVLRFDQLLTSIFKAFPQYLVIWLLLATTVAGSWLGIIASASAAAYLGLGSGILTTLISNVLINAAQAYCIIVSMRIIGLFYRHYKTRFAWEAE